MRTRTARTILGAVFDYASMVSALTAHDAELATALRPIFAAPFDPRLDLAPSFRARFADVIESEQDAISDIPSLAAVGFALLDAANATPMRVRGCHWLTLFPSCETVDALARILDDDSAPIELRNQAAWTLGFRQARATSDRCLWALDAMALADEALTRAFDRGDHRALTRLAPALRHVAAPASLDALAARPVDAAAALEAFCTPRLAHALLDALPSIATEHAPRIIRLIGATLGAECAPRLLAYANDAPIAERIEALFAAFTVDPARALPALEGLVRTLTFPDRIVRRLEFHRSHPDYWPTIEGLRIARTTGALPGERRIDASRVAARHLLAASEADLLNESAATELWQHAAWRSHQRDPLAYVTAIESDVSSIDHDDRLCIAYLDALATLGRFDALERVARDHNRVARGAWLLACHGRPFRALAALDLAPSDDLLTHASEALALFLAGRPDKAAEVLEAVDGATMRPAKRRERMRGHDAAERAVASRSMEPLFGAMHAAAPEAQPDRFDPAVVARSVERVRVTNLRGATIHLAGRIADSDIVRRALEHAGASIVSGPFGKTDFFVRGEAVDDEAIARLVSRGVREIPRARIDMLVRALGAND